MLNIVVWFVYLPYKDNKLTEEFNQYKNLRSELASGSFLTFEDIYNRRDRLGEIEKRLRSQKDFSKLITYLFEQSMLARAEVRDVNYSFEDKKDLQLVKLTLQLNLEGGYEDLRRFIYSMESGSHLFQVGNVKIARGQQNVNASLSLITYLKVSQQ